MVERAGGTLTVGQQTAFHITAESTVCPAGNFAACLIGRAGEQTLFHILDKISVFSGGRFQNSFAVSKGKLFRFSPSVPVGRCAVGGFEYKIRIEEQGFGEGNKFQIFQRDQIAFGNIDDGVGS